MLARPVDGVRIDHVDALGDHRLLRQEDRFRLEGRVGLGIGLLQAVTQIQEQTLVFVPKIVAIFLVLLLALPFAGAAMNGLMIDIAGRIAAY